MGRQNGSGPFRVSEAANLGLHALAVIAAGPEPVARTREIAARLKLHNQYTDELALGRAKQEGVEVALVYRQWFSSPAWTEVGQWRIRGNVTCAHDDVSICAVDSSATAELVRNLRAFASDLPADVEQFGPYTQK